MNKLTQLTGLACIATLSVSCQATGQIPFIIPQASYVVFNGYSRIGGRTPTGSRTATFYTYDGNPLQTIAHHQRFDAVRHKLDPRAPKPRPAFCGVISWTGPSAGNDAGDYLRFFDRNYCNVQTYRYNKETGTLRAIVADGRATMYHFRTLEELKNLDRFPLDLSAIDEISEVTVKN